MEMLVTSEFVQLFDRAFETGTSHYQDWAAEAFTCATLDRREHAVAGNPHVGDPHLRSELWDGKLLFAGSEFAAQQAGYLEGALLDAARVADALTKKVRKGRQSPPSEELNRMEAQV
jgi:monoamine oxidase